MSRKACALPSTPSDDPSVSRPRTSLVMAERWRDLFGCEPLPGAGFIGQAIAWREQVLAHGDVAPAIARDLAIAARQVREARSAAVPVPPSPQPESKCLTAEVQCSEPEAERLRPIAPRTRSRAAPAPLPPASSQLLPGTRLVKAHGGRNHVVEVTEAGFVYDGQAFASLSAVAKHITGTHWNGLLFFGLRRRKTYPAKAAAGG